MSSKWVWLDDARKLEALETALAKIKDAVKALCYLEEHMPEGEKTATTYRAVVVPALLSTMDVMYAIEDFRNKQARKPKKEV